MIEACRQRVLMRFYQQFNPYFYVNLKGSDESDG